MRSPKFLIRCGGTSLFALAASLGSAAQAQSIDDGIISNGACGEAVDGSVYCDADDRPFPNGIVYREEGDLTIGVEPGEPIEPEDGAAGIIGITLDGALTIDAAGVNITTKNATGVVAHAGTDLFVSVGDISTEVTEPGEIAPAIDTYHDSGFGFIQAGNISTVGDYSMGIRAQSTSGAIFIDAASITTNGFSSDGVELTGGGDMYVTIGEVSSVGDYNWAVNLTNGNEVDGTFISGYSSISIGKVSMIGESTAGVVLNTLSDARIDIGELNISGQFSAGVQAYGLGNIGVRVGNATIAGAESFAIFAYGENGGVQVDAGNIVVEAGSGITAGSYYGDVAVTAQRVEAHGDFQGAVLAATVEGDATVRVGEVSTDGLFAAALDVQAPKGELSVGVGSAMTSGDYSHAIRSVGRSSTIAVSGPVSTQGDFAHGLLSSTTYGDAIAVMDGDVTTAGEVSHAVWLTGRYGAASLVSRGDVAATGGGSRGIFIEAQDGEIDLFADTVSTSGDITNGIGANGIHARTVYVEIFAGQTDVDPKPFTGDISITARSVQVTGLEAIGISARGIGNSDILVGDASSKHSFALESDMIGTVSMDIRGSAVSEFGSAVLARGKDVDISIGAGAEIAGGIDGIVIDAVGERCILPNPDDGSANPCPNPGFDYYDIGDGGGIGIGSAVYSAEASHDDFRPLVELEGSAILRNAGSISGGDGVAVRVVSGRVDLINEGVIHGAIAFGDGADVFDNQGMFLVSGDSDFGNGFDLLDNRGIVKFASASTPASYSFGGLEQFENSGLVDLRNQIAGDSLRVDGDYSGNSGATLLLDVDVQESRADTFVVDGTATGSTRIILDVDGDSALLTGSDGIALVSAGGGTEGDAFSLANQSRGGGFVSYDLRHLEGEFVLFGTASAGAYRQLGVIRAAEQASRLAVDGWRTRNGAVRDLEFRSDAARPNSSLWGAIAGGRTKQDWTTEDSQGDEISLDFRNTNRGGYIGADIAGWSGERSTARFGVLGHYTDSELTYRDAADSADISTFGLGIYGSYETGTFFANFLGRYDSHDIRIASASLGSPTKIDGTSWGLEIEAGTHFGSAAFFVEPKIGLSWSKAAIDDLVQGAQSIDFDEVSGLTGRLGARLGSTGLGADRALVVYGDVNLVHDFGDAYSANLAAGSSQRLTADRAPTYGEGALGVTWSPSSTIQFFGEGITRIGRGIDGLTGRIGISVGF